MTLAIILNGERREVAGPLTIAALLTQFGYDGTAVAVARNGEFVPRAERAHVPIQAGDDLEIVAPMQGG